MDPIIEEVFEPNRVSKLLAEIWGREHGYYETKGTLMPKDSPTSPQQEEGG